MFIPHLSAGVTNIIPSHSSYTNTYLHQGVAKHTFYDSSHLHNLQVWWVPKIQDRKSFFFHSKFAKNEVKAVKVAVSAALLNVLAALCGMLAATLGVQLFGHFSKIMMYPLIGHQLTLKMKKAFGPPKKLTPSIP